MLPINRKTIWTDEKQFVVAASPEEAEIKYREITDNHFEPVIVNRWTPLPRNKPFTYDNITKSVGEWADENSDFYAYATMKRS